MTATVEDNSMGQVVADYWTEVNVTQHHMFKTAEESLEYFHWRNDLYRGYIERMPVFGQDGKVVLDYGCGPGHDLVGFSAYSKPARLIGMDVSISSLAETRSRLMLHNAKCDLIRLDPEKNMIPLEDNSVDYIHSSGVLHHVADLMPILKEFRRIIRPNGKMRIMVYNYDSIWLHLFVAYKKMLVEGEFSGMTLRQAFAKTTDGPGCPISHVYKPDEFMNLVTPAGFKGQYNGAAVSVHEASMFQDRYVAILDRRLPAESRKFLLDLELDSSGFPIYQGTYAGVDGCYEFIPV